MLHNTYVFQNGFQVSNRLVLAPMTNLQSHADGSLSQDEIRFLEMRAQGGFGIITTCAAYVHPQGKAWPGQIGFNKPEFEPGLTELAKRIKKHNSLAIAQLFHGGSRASTSVSGMPKVSASDIYKNGKLDAQELNENEIYAIIQNFADAASRLKKCGFDGVEIHGAHGYLIHQFLSKATNKRRDDWGGSAANRERFLMHTYREIRALVGQDFLVGVRLSPEDKLFFEGIDFDETLELAQKLEAEGLDFIHISLWDAFKKPEKYPKAQDMAITYFRKVLKPETCLITAGGIQTLEGAQRILEAGADLIALGRIALPHPDWPMKVQEPNWRPMSSPYTKAYLAQQGLNPTFIEYMRRWEGFVLDQKSK